MVPLRGMIEDHVQDHFDPGPVQGLDQIPEFVQHCQWVFPGAIPLVGSKEGHRGVTPIVDQSRRAVLDVELEDREQFHGSDPQVFQVRNLFHEPGEGASLLRGDPRAGMPGEPSHMQFINNGLGKRALERLIPLPIIPAQVGHHALHGLGGILPRPTGQVPTVTRGNRHGPAVGVQQDFLRIKSGAFLGRPWPRHPVPINLAGFEAGDEDVPVMIGPVLAGIESNHPFGLGRIHFPEQEQFYSSGAFGEDAEVDSFRINRGP